MYPTSHPTIAPRRYNAAVCINIAVFDAIATLRRCTMQQVIEALPDVDQITMRAVHRLREQGTLQIHHELTAG